MSEAVWQILDVGSIWMKEFASAMQAAMPVVAWEPVMSLRGMLGGPAESVSLPEPPLRILRYPLQRGYARAPLRTLVPFERAVLRRLRAHCPAPADSPLICSTPFYAPVAEHWPGPVVYYSTDLTARYAGLDEKQVVALDRRMCAAAAAVCPNSRRIAAYLAEQAGCEPAKITVVPNATRESNVSPEPLLTPGPLPADIAHLPRPIAGVIGNLSANMDWVLLHAVVAEMPHLQWVFVGPTTMAIAEREQAEARAAVMTMPRTFFTGGKPYGELQAYARCFDVAVLPYRKKEPTYSGSSTRFYEHLAACRPMVGTEGFAELLEKPPLLSLADTAAAMREALDSLAEKQFHDGYETQRWEASRAGTWEARVRTLVSTIAPARAV